MPSTAIAPAPPATTYERSGVSVLPAGRVDDRQMGGDDGDIASGLEAIATHDASGLALLDIA